MCPLSIIRGDKRLQGLDSIPSHNIVIWPSQDHGRRKIAPGQSCLIFKYIWLRSSWGLHFIFYLNFSWSASSTQFIPIQGAVMSRSTVLPLDRNWTEDGVDLCLLLYECLIAVISADHNYFMIVYIHQHGWIFSIAITISTFVWGWTGALLVLSSCYIPSFLYTLMTTKDRISSTYCFPQCA